MTKSARKILFSMFAGAALLMAGGGFWSARFRSPPMPPGLPPLYYDPFVQDLMRDGRYVLECGGGVIPEPRHAIRALRGKYGDQGLRDRSLWLLFDQPAAVEYPEGAISVAMGILYHLADDATLEKLLAIHRRLAGPPASPNLDRCDVLIAGICSRLGRKLPDGIPPLSRQDEDQAFQGEAPFWDEELVDLIRGLFHFGR